MINKTKKNFLSITLPSELYKKVEKLAKKGARAVEKLAKEKAKAKGEFVREVIAMSHNI